MAVPSYQKTGCGFKNISLISCSDTRHNDNKINTCKGVHFFVDDYRFEGIYKNPVRTLEKYSQYAFLLIPDYSTYADMNYYRQLESIAYSHWLGGLGAEDFTDLSAELMEKYKQRFWNIELFIPTPNGLMPIVIRD